MRIMYKRVSEPMTVRGSSFSFQGVMLDSKRVPDDEVKNYEREGWGTAWSCLDESLPDGGDYERQVRDKIKALGGKPAGRSSIATLEKQLAELEGNNNGD